MNKTVFSILSIILILLFACEEKVDEAEICVSNLTCGDQKTCFQGRCVGYEIDPEKDSYTLYKEEFHYRLVNACASCHTSGQAAENENAATPDQPYYIPPMPIGEPGYWRIYAQDLTEDKIRKSYEETLLQIDSLDPESSPLLAYGRGEYTLGITDENGVEYAHPTLYQPSVYDQKGNLIYVIDVDYQRTVEWVKIWANKYNQEQGIIAIDMGFMGGMTAGSAGSDEIDMNLNPAGMPAGMPAGAPQPQPTGNRLDASLFNDLVKPAYTKPQACLSCHKGSGNGFKFNPSNNLAELQTQLDTIIKPLINFNQVDQSPLFKKLESSIHQKARANSQAFIVQTKLWIEQSNE